MGGVPHPSPMLPAVAAGLEVLRRPARKIALAGRLQVSEERALALLRSVGTGTVLTLLGEPETRRGLKLSETARDAVLAVITSETPASADYSIVEAATALRASLDQTSVLTSGERLLLQELLDRIADGLD